MKTETFIEQAKKWLSAIALETFVLSLLMGSIFVIHWISDKLLGSNPTLWDGRFPVNYFFDTAHAVAMARYLYRLVRGFFDEGH